MKKIWQFFALILLIVQSVSPGIVMAYDTASQKNDFILSDIVLSNTGEVIEATIEGNFQKSDISETSQDIEVSKNFKLENTSNQILLTDSGVSKGTYHISDNVLHLKTASDGDYSVKINLSGTYNSDYASKEVTFSDGKRTISKALTGLDDVQTETTTTKSEIKPADSDVVKRTDDNLSKQEANVSMAESEISETNFDSGIITKSNVTPVEQFTTDTHIGRIFINGNKDSIPNALENAFVEITIPSENVETFEVPPAGIIKNTTKIPNDDGTTTIRVYLTKLDSTTTASFPFAIKFTNRETPGGYTIEPKVTLNSGEENTPNTIDASGDLKMTTKVIQPSIKKYVFSNSNDAYSKDKIDVYAGMSSKLPGTHIDSNLQDITFQYAMNTWQAGGSDNNATARNRSRQYNNIILTDTLPVYTDTNGNQVRAQFDPDKNPGWVLSSDGKTVSKTVTATNLDANNDAARLVSNEKLVLTFNGAPYGLNSNTIDADISINNKANDEENPTVNDDIKFNLTSDVRLPDGMFDKRYVGDRNILLESGQNHLLRARYRLYLDNKTSVPMSNIVLTDTKFDSELYLHAISGDVNRVKAVYGIKTDGTKELIADPFSVIDSNTVNEINEQVEAVNQGANPDSQEQVPPEYTGLEIQLKDDYKLMPGQGLTYDILLGLTSPYNVQKNISTSKQVYNEAKVDFSLLDGSNTPKTYEVGPATDYGVLIPKTERITISKGLANNVQGTIGERVGYPITLNLSQLYKTRTIKNARFVDLLPSGVTFDGTGSSSDDYTIVDNYLNSGRQAIIFNLGDLDLSQMGNNTSISKYVYAVINDKAVPSDKTTVEKNNKNYVYLTGDNLDDLIKDNEIGTPNTIKDYYDVNGNGDKSEAVIGAERDISVNLPAEIKSIKWIRGEGQTAWIPTGMDTTYGQNFDYNLSTENYGDSLIKEFSLYDRLPYQGDGNDSQFANTLRGPIQVPDGFTAYYRTDDSKGIPEVEIKSDEWLTTVSDYSKVTAIKVVMNEGTQVQSGESIDVIVPMTAPSYTDGALDNLSANNSFYTSRDGEESFGKTNNVYNRMPQSLKVSKNWVDGKLESIKVNVYRESNPNFIVRTATLNEANNYTYQFNDLPGVDDKGEVITDYKVREVIASTEASIEDYQVTISGNQKDGYVITNELIKTAVSGEKVWDDANNQDGIRPESIKVNLFANGQKIDEQTVSAATNWKFSFDNLRKSSHDTDIVYTVTEDAIPGYTMLLDISDKSKIVIKNVHIPEVVNFSGIKTWDDHDNQDGLRPTSITVNLLANGQKVAEKSVTEDDHWQYAFTDLPKFANGKAIVYTVTENSVANYETKYDGNDIINIHSPNKTRVTVTKNWDDANNQDGIRPDSIKVQLYAGDDKVGDEVELNAENKWNYTFDNLNVNQSGQAIQYTVKEVGAVAGYTTTTDDSDKGNVVITNHHIPELTEVKGNKTWDDHDNQDGLRPTSITVNLLANGQKVAEKSVTEDDHWQYAFTDLPKFANGKAIVYTVTENAVANYNAKVDGFNLVNTHAPLTKSISVTKKWSDFDNKYKTRADKIQVQLYADGLAVGEVVDVTAITNWQYIWKNLAVNKAGKVIVYTIREVTQVPGYEVSIDETNKSNIILTNTLIKVPKADTVKDNNKVLPTTSDTDQISYLLIGLVLLGLFGFILYLRKVVK